MLYNDVEGRIINSIKVLRTEFQIKGVFRMILRSFFLFLIENIYCVPSLEPSSVTSYLEHCTV